MGGRTTPQRLRELAASFSGETAEISRTISERIRDEVDELRAIDDPSFWEVVDESNRSNLDAGIAALTGGPLRPDAAPLDATAAARFAAGSGVSLGALLRAYRIAHRVAWNLWVRRVEALDCPPGERQVLLEQASDMLFAFVDHVASLVTDEYTRERDALMRTREQRRVQRVRDLVDGRALDTRELDYEVDVHHVGLVVSGPGAQRALQAMAHAAGLRLLAVAVDDAVWWGWLGSRDAIDEDVVRAAVAAAPADAVVGVSDPLAGLAGFSAAHQQAADARLIAQRLGLAVCRFGDVALEAFALRDEQLARRFVARELRGLDGADDRSCKLRDTLRAYFAAGHNASAASARLGVHDQTVAYRLRTVEERIGQPVAERRAELELALRLQGMLDHGGA